MKSLLTSLFCILTASSLLSAAETPDWRNPNVVEVNRYPMTATFETSGNKLTLNGVWDFKWYETVDDRALDFYKTDYDISGWDTMPVPGLWELNGYGDPLYVNIGYAWRPWYENNPPFVPVQRNHAGQYRRTFVLDGAWTGKDVFLYIGSATSNVRVWVNGKEVGYSEDSKLQAVFDITKYVKPGENLVALEVFRWCDGTYLEDQDFFRFTGLARDTYVYSREKKDKPTKSTKTSTPSSKPSVTQKPVVLRSTVQPEEISPEFTIHEAGELAEGMMIQHFRFGEGVVENIDCAGADSKIRVRFIELDETKLLMLRFAKFKILE